jgi:hypothetical protein
MVKITCPDGHFVFEPSERPRCPLCEATCRVLDALAYTGEVEVDDLATRLGIQSDVIDSVTADPKVFTVWSSGEPHTVELTDYGRDVARAVVADPPSPLRVGSRVRVKHHPGRSTMGLRCSCPVEGPWIGEVLGETPNALGLSYLVELPCGAQVQCTDGMLG